MSKSEDFDFGFTALDIGEATKVASSTTGSKLYTEDDLNKIIEGLLSRFKPLLDNLKKNPEKPTIHWPNRKEKIEQFENEIDKYLASMFE